MKQTLEKVLLPVQWMVQRVVGIIHLLSVATVVWMTCASVDVGIQTENWMKHQWPSRTPWTTAGSSIFRSQKDFFTATFCGFHLFALPICVIPPCLFLPHILWNFTKGKGTIVLNFLHLHIICPEISKVFRDDFITFLSLISRKKLRFSETLLLSCHRSITFKTVRRLTPDSHSPDWKQLPHL